MKSKDIALKIAEKLDEKLAKNVTIIDINEKSSIADFMIVSSGGSVRQIDTLKDEVERIVETSGMGIKSIEGKKESGWILLDCGDIIVNLFTDEMREKYTIEKVWGDCETILMEERNVE